jgi:hypothetical protein
MPLTRTLAYADVEALLTSWLQGQLGAAARVVTETPANITQTLVQVIRIGGARRFTFDHATVDIECFATTRQLARAMSDQVGLLLEQTLPGQRIGAGSVGAVICTSGPSWLPWDDTNVRRFGATYQVNVHAAQ